MNKPAPTWVKLTISAALIGILLAAIGFGIEGMGPFTTAGARHLRAMKDRIRSPDSFEEMTFDEFARLPAHPTPEVRDSLESRAVRLEGYVEHIRRATDGDCHLDVTRAPRSSNGVDQPFLTAEISPVWRRMVPGWTYEALRQAFRSRDGQTTAEPRRVRLTGWLLYDFHSVKLPRAIDPHGIERVSAWEIHPVTHIEVWEDAQKRMVDFGGRPVAANR